MHVFNISKALGLLLFVFISLLLVSIIYDSLINDVTLTLQIKLAMLVYTVWAIIIFIDIFFEGGCSVTRPT